MIDKHSPLHLTVCDVWCAEQGEKFVLQVARGVVMTTGDVGHNALRLDMD